MNGFIAKVTTLLLVSMTFLPATTSASNANETKHQLKIYRSKMGCMTCHQAESMQEDSESNNSEDN